MNSEPIKKLTHLLKKILTATSSLTNVGIDYSHPDYDDDWSRSRLKLQPLLTHELHRPLALADDDDRRLQSRLLLRSASRMLVASTGSSSAAASGVHSGAASTAPSGSRSRRQLLLLLLLFLALQRRLSINTGESEESFYSNGISINVTKSHPEGADEDNKNHNMVALKHIINVPLSTLTTLSIKPGEPHFILWYFISSFFPLITACLGPVANMISVIGLIQHWRIDIATGVEKNDDGYLLALNIILLVLGILGNASLLMNFSGRVRYLVTQSMSISCWLVASLLLVIDVAVTKVKFFNGPVMVADTITGVITPTYYRPSEGYWYAVLTAGLYFICTLILSTNFLGYKLKKYPPTFNLGPKQRSLMIFTICLAVWLLAGAILFAHMIPNVTYGSSLYFCTVSILTIGLGDITPISWGSKVLVLAFSLIGVLIMGLIITMIRQVVLAAGGPTIFWHQIERDRLRLLEELMAKYKSGDENFTMSPTKAFREMRKIRRNAKIRQSHISLILTVVNFMIFWLLGATVFYFTEEWSYFNAVYFCFLCLITIGYGDFAPKTRLGRAFFVCWGIGAIPLMTILISNVGDTLYDIANRISYFMAKWFFPDYYRYLIEKRKKLKDERAKLNKLQHEDKKHKSGIKRGSFNDLRRLLTKGSIHPPDCDCCHKSKKPEGDEVESLNDSIPSETIDDDTNSIEDVADNIEKTEMDEGDGEDDDIEAIVNEMGNTDNLDIVEEAIKKLDKEKRVGSAEGNTKSSKLKERLKAKYRSMEKGMRRSRLEKGNIDRKIPGENKDVVTAHRSESELSESAIKSKDNNAKDEGVATAEKDEIDLLQSGETQHSSLRKAVHSDERSDDLSPNNSANQANSEDISEMQPAHRPASPLSLSEIPYAGAPSVVPPKPTSTVHNDTSDAFIREILQQLDIIKRDSDRMQNFMAILKPLISDSIDDPKKRYDHDEWESLLGTLHETDRESLNPMASDFYWLSESSPLRLPLNEPNYLTMKFVIRMELDLKNSLAVDIRNLERLIRESRSIKLLSQGNVQISRTKDHT